MTLKTAFFICFLMMMYGCSSNKTMTETPTMGTYEYDAGFLRKYDPAMVELSDATGTSRVLVSPKYQGRVMTSTAGTNSYGWINYDLIASKQWKKQFNPVGGEERFWLGPEGGQFSIYFQPGDTFNIKHWQVPAVIDTITYRTTTKTDSTVQFDIDASLTNYSKTVFDIHIKRSVKLLAPQSIEQQLGISIPGGVLLTGFETSNEVTNKGTADWKKESGCLSVWLLGMFTPTENTTVIIPFQKGPDSKTMITTNYFGEIPADRLTIKDDVLFFKCDGKFRSKLGLPPQIALGIAGSFDFKKNVLTVIKFPVSTGPEGYVNSKWEIQNEPFKGDVVNSYNDGPLADGSQLGPFYELESSSSALELKSGQSRVYAQVTSHFEGDFESLNALCKQLLKVDLNDIKNNQ